MTKLVQKSAIVVMIVVTVLFLSGCGPLFPSDNGRPVGHSFNPATDVTGGVGCSYMNKESNRKYFDFAIVKASEYYALQVEYKNIGKMANGWFDSVTVNSVNYSGAPFVSSNKDNISFSLNGLTKDGLLEILPAGGSWTVKFISESHSDRNVTYTIPAEYVTEIREWLAAN